VLSGLSVWVCRCLPGAVDSCQQRDRPGRWLSVAQLTGVVSPGRHYADAAARWPPFRRRFARTGPAHALPDRGRPPHLFSRNAPGVAWKTKPSWYIVATHDRTVQPDLERFLAKRMNATTYEVESSHVVMLSHPEFVLDVIRDAATAVQGNAAGSATV